VSVLCTDWARLSEAVNTCTKNCEHALVELGESIHSNLSGESIWTAEACGIKGSRPACAPESVQRCAICDTGCDTAAGLGGRLRSVDGKWNRQVGHAPEGRRGWGLQAVLAEG
jgi:hypothetical protein